LVAVSGASALGSLLGRRVCETGVEQLPLDGGASENLGLGDSLASAGSLLAGSMAYRASAAAVAGPTFVRPIACAVSPAILAQAFFCS
jgi:hypothetical protein